MMRESRSPASMTAPPRHRRERASGNPDGNERLTALTGVVLLVLFAAEGVTILRLRDLLTLHFFLGMLLLGPVALKISSTLYRFTRYYAGSLAYVRKGPPAPLLRLLGPMVVLTSLAVLGTGVVLAATGPGSGQWLFWHKASFVLWFGCMTIHVLAYALRLPGLLAGSADRTRQALAGARLRWLLLAAALGAGLVIALLTVHLSARWGFRPAVVMPPGRHT
jgi:hypothetical protein